MPLKHRIANQLWMRATSAGHQRFLDALSNVRATQEGRLRQLVERNAHTAFGRQCGFAGISSVAEYQRRVPLLDYEELRPWVEAIRNGQRNVLTHAPIERLHASSGTSSATKYIPFGDGLRQEFFAGIAPWMNNLLTSYPALRSGSSFWIVTPAIFPAPQQSKVAISYDEDENYLPRYARLAQRMLRAVSKPSMNSTEPKEMRYQSAKQLLCASDLALISVWNPSYLRLILETLLSERERLADEMRSGSQQMQRRFKEIRGLLDFAGATVRDIDWQGVWPKLTLLSCWADGWAGEMADSLRELFPTTVVQPKGLLATEAFVSLPFVSERNDRGSPVLSVNSHFFEFLDLQSGRVLLAEQLEESAEYEVIVSTAGGLYRYRLGDLVRCTGHLNQAPRLQFMQKENLVADITGEKLNVEHLEQSLSHCAQRYAVPRDALFVAPDQAKFPPRYRLYLKKAHQSTAATLRTELEALLGENVHYDHSRALGQLAELEVAVLDEETWVQYRYEGMRRSTAKSYFLERRELRHV